MNKLVIRSAPKAGWIGRLVGVVTLTRNGLALIGLTALGVVLLIQLRPQFAASLHRMLTPLVQETQDTPGLSGTAGAQAAKATSMLGLAPAVPVLAATTPSLDQGDGRDLPLSQNGAQSDVKTGAFAKVSSSAVVQEAARHIDMTGLGTAKEHAAITRYLARKYHVSASAVELLVSAAYLTGKESGLDPALLLAVMGVESGFNPFAESVMGAQGLMQVMSKIHADKLGDFGGDNAALNPVTNIKVGALILKDCIRRAGSERDGLRLYVGAGNEDDGGYGMKVIQEKDRILFAARGGNPLAQLENRPVPAAPAVAPAAQMPVNASSITPVSAPAMHEPLRHTENTEVKPKERVAAL